MKILCALLLLLSFSSFGRETDVLANKVFGVEPEEKFSFHEPSYFIFGTEDLKLQFGFKYRLSKSFNLYFAYSQLMFWSIYKESKPFRDVNYKPEVFYRLMDKKNDFFTSLDLGYLHHSNGQEDIDSRSLDRLFLRTTFLTKVRRNTLGAILRLHYIYNEDPTNEDIVNHQGFWELHAFLLDLILMEGQTIDLTLRTYAGSKIYDLDKGGYELGLVYNLDNSYFNPSVFFQRFEGYSESLLGYDKKRTEYRLGLLLSF